MRRPYYKSSRLSACAKPLALPEIPRPGFCRRQGAMSITAPPIGIGGGRVPFYCAMTRTTSARLHPFNRGKCNFRFCPNGRVAGGFTKRVTQILSGAPRRRSRPRRSLRQQPHCLSRCWQSDMKAAYVRLVTGFRRGFTVAPDPSADVPSDASAETHNNALSGPVPSISSATAAVTPGSQQHLKLQLELARAKSTQAEGPPGKLNRRIVWAPKFLTGGLLRGSGVGCVPEP
jgi:hypothetical protein